MESTQDNPVNNDVTAPAEDSAATASATEGTAAGATGTAAKRNPIVAFLTRPVGGNANSPRRASRFTRCWRRHRPSDRALGWIAPLIVTAIGGFIRFFRLGTPNVLLFDEDYYVKDAWAMLKTGTERNWPETIDGTDAGTLFVQGQTDLFTSQPESIFTHPPLGKWLIAIGMKIFGPTPFGWRFFPALAGTICILLVARVALRLFHNVTIATTAAILMAFDGHAITMSRTAMLDIFVTAFTLAAFLCLLNHRDWAKARLLAAHERDVSRPGSVIRTVPLTDRERRGEGGDTRAAAGRPSVRLVVDSSGPIVTFTWWRLAGVVLLALGTGVKWNTLWFFAVFAVMSVAWDAYDRRTVGYSGWFQSLIGRDGILTALWTLPVYALTYVTTWMSWFLTDDSWGRHWAQEHPGQGVTWLPDTPRSFIYVHISDLQASSSITRVHPMASSPFMWPLQLSSTTFARVPIFTSRWSRTTYPPMCSLTPRLDCMETVTNVGNPVVWWVGSICLLLALFFAWRRRGDWRALAVWSGIAAGWMPWLLFLQRTLFAYYSISFLPWIILGTCYGLDWLRCRRDPTKPGTLRRNAICLDIAVIAVAVFLYPIWTDLPVSTEGWLMRMVFPGWIQTI